MVDTRHAVGSISAWVVSSLLIQSNYIYFGIVIALMIFDWITGVFACLANNEKLCRKKAYKGFLKKTSSIILVLVACLFDIIIQKEGSTIGINLPSGWKLYLLTLFYISFSELTSILDNYKKINGSVPKFLSVFAKKGEQRLNDVVEDEEEK